MSEDKNKKKPREIKHFDPRISYENPDLQEAAKVCWSTVSVDWARQSISKGYPVRASPFVNNNVSLKEGNLLFLHKLEEKEEFAHCKIDLMYFAEKYCKLKTSSGRTEPIVLRKYQKRILKSIQNNPYTIILAGRQVGKTTTTAIAILWFVTFHAEFTVALLGDKHDTAVENLDKIKDIYCELPFYMKAGIFVWNVRSVVFDTKSKIITGPCKKSAIVGKSINLLYIDELAIPLPHLSKEVVEYALPTMETFAKEGKGKVVFSSTPNGDNVFKDFWVNAVRGLNGFVPVPIKWWEVPGRDLAWKKETLAKYGEDSFNEQFNCIFLSSASSYYSQHTIDLIERGITNYVPLDTDIEAVNKMQWRILDDNTVNIEPEPVEFLAFAKDIDVGSLKDEYIIIQMDIAEGTGLDYTVANIFMLKETKKPDTKKQREQEEAVQKWNPDHDTAPPSMYYDEQSVSDNVKVEQIGIFHTNRISIPAFAMFVRIISNTLFDKNKIRINFEINKYGGHLKTLLLSDKYMDFELDQECLGVTVFNEKDIIGVNITSRTKPLYVKLSKSLLETQKITINELRTVEEMKYFGQVKNSYAAMPGHHDDIIMTVVGLAAFVSPMNDNWVSFCEEFAEDSDDTLYTQQENWDY